MSDPIVQGGANLRSILYSAFAFVRSVEMNRASSAVTLDALIQEQINFLKKGAIRPMVDNRGESVGSRLSRWDRLDRLSSDLQEAVQAVTAAGDDADKLRALGVYEVDY